VVGLCPHRRQVIPIVALEPGRAGSLGNRGPGTGRPAVLILRTSQGPWGISIDRDATAISAERPTRHEPREGAGACVTLGSIRLGKTDFALLDPESTWQSVRKRIVNWYAGAGENGNPPEAWSPGQAGGHGDAPQG
jgi:purine-binding chemotaxis protein CheW